jgi:hypothetical protein
MALFRPRNAALLLLLAGCAASSEDEEEAGAALTPVRPMTVCFGGRTIGDPYSIGGIQELDDLCKKLPGLVRDEPLGRDAKYAFFQWDTDVAHVLDRLVATLDTNGDGFVTNVDAPVDLTFVGYSWGGFNACELGEKIAGDRRFSASRKGIARVFTLDAFRTDVLVFPRAELRVPSNVHTFYSFRHSVAPADECSSFVFGLVGPFTGRVPRCTGSTVCHDYDFSLNAATAGVDHCDVPGAADDSLLAIVNGRTPAGVPPEVAVGRY